MKAISLWQPWASLMALGVKTIETRSWHTHHTGPLAIHAAQKVIDWPDMDMQELLKVDHPRDLPRGILCTVDLLEVRKITAFNAPGFMERRMGNYTPGRFMWLTTNLIRLETPIPFCGRQTIFNVPDDLLNSDEENLA